MQHWPITLAGLPLFKNIGNIIKGISTVIMIVVIIIAISTGVRIIGWE